MPSKIQQSAMGLGSRYPLFENDFMQHGVRFHFCVSLLCLTIKIFNISEVFRFDFD